MGFRISKEHVWVGVIADRADALADKLRQLREGGLNLELIISRREQPGRALLFVSPLRTVEEIDYAEKVGLSRSGSFLALRIQGPNEPGLGARIAGTLGEAGLNMRGFTAAALGDLQVTNIAFDQRAMADRAKEALEKELNG